MGRLPRARMGSWGVQTILATNPCSKSLTRIISTLSHTFISSTSKLLDLTPFLRAATTPFLFTFLQQNSLKTNLFSLTNYSYYLLNLAQLGFPHCCHHSTETALVKVTVMFMLPNHSSSYMTLHW